MLYSINDFVTSFFKALPAQKYRDAFGLFNISIIYFPKFELGRVGIVWDGKGMSMMSGLATQQTIDGILNKKTLLTVRL